MGIGVNIAYSSLIKVLVNPARHIQQGSFLSGSWELDIFDNKIVKK